MKKPYLLSFILFCLFSYIEINGQARNDCQAGVTTVQFDVNNVSTLIGPGGTFWPEGYVVPNTLPAPVNAIYTGGLWVGGFDSGGNLKLAAQTYGSTSENEYFPGPLDPLTGDTEMDICEKWDRVFKVRQSEIDAFLDDLDDNGTLDQDHPTIFGWPGRGNVNFPTVHAFDLPDQNLAPFVDTNGDGLYTPNDGDYPAIKGEEALWWVINDAGGIHPTTMATPLRFEFQIMAFASSSEDPAIDNTTFYDIKIINRGLESLDSTMITLWIDPDLGCYTDDYAGCSPENDLAYVYNADAIDGNNNCTCDQGVNTYCEDIPVLGVKLLESPEGPDGEETGMTSFGVYNSASLSNFPPGTADPNIAVEYYRLMSGFWPDGSPFTEGGNGYQTGDPTPFLYPDSPNNANGWSMCTANIGGGDIRMLISSGNINIAPGQTTKLSFAVTLVESIAYPCPDIDPLIEASEMIENFYFGLPTSTEDQINNDANIRVFPNPAKENVQLHLQSDEDELAQLILFDAHGKEIRSFTRLTGTQFELQRKGLSAGVYFYKLHTKNGKVTNGKLLFN